MTVGASDPDDLDPNEFRQAFAAGIPAEINPGPRPVIVTKQHPSITRVSIGWGEGVNAR